MHRISTIILFILRFEHHSPGNIQSVWKGINYEYSNDVPYNGVIWFSFQFSPELNQKKIAHNKPYETNLKTNTHLLLTHFPLFQNEKKNIIQITRNYIIRKMNWINWPWKIHRPKHIFMRQLQNFRVRLIDLIIITILIL